MGGGRATIPKTRERTDQDLPVILEAIDTALGSDRKLATLRRRLRRLRVAVEQRVGNRALWVAYEDTRLTYHVAREEEVFRIAHRQGLLLGLAEAREEKRDRKAQALERELRRAVIVAGIPRRRVATVLLQMVQGLVR